MRRAASSWRRRGIENGFRMDFRSEAGRGICFFAIGAATSFRSVQPFSPSLGITRAYSLWRHFWIRHGKEEFAAARYAAKVLNASWIPPLPHGTRTRAREEEDF